jgi:hypothetical protein
MKKGQELAEYPKDCWLGLNARMTNCTSYLIQEQSDCPVISGHAERARH